MMIKSAYLVQIQTCSDAFVCVLCHLQVFTSKNSTWKVSVSKTVKLYTVSALNDSMLSLHLPCWKTWPTLLSHLLPLSVFLLRWLEKEFKIHTFLSDSSSSDEQEAEAADVSDPSDHSTLNMMIHFFRKASEVSRHDQWSRGKINLVYRIAGNFCGWEFSQIS